MPVYWIVLLLTAAATAVMGSIFQHAEKEALSTDLTAAAHNMIVYRNALAEYSHSNPTKSGQAVDTALALPSWFVHMPGINGYVSNGSSFTYYPAPPDGLVSELIRLTGTSVAIGYVQNGQIISPSAGTIGVTVPAAIPSGSAIAFQ